MPSPESIHAPAGAPRALDAARALAREHWGLEARDAVPLPGEHDQNVRIEGPDGARRVLKLSRPGEERALLDLQHAVLSHLAEALPHRTLPRVHRARSGDGIVTLSDDDGRPRLARLLDWVPGVPLATVRPKGPDLLEDVGALVGEVDGALAGFAHPAARRRFDWDLRRGIEVVERLLPAVPEGARRALLEHHMATVRAAAPAWDALPVGVIHGDANDWNVLVSPADPAAPLAPRRAVSLIDFGDVLESWVAGEPAIAIAYAMLGRRAPLEAARAVARGYHRQRPLAEAEVDALWPLALLRLCVSVCMAAHQRPRQPDNAYLSVSEGPAWALLERLAEEVHPRFATYALREACGLPACPAAARVRRWLDTGARPGPVLETPGGAAGRVVVLDLSVGSPETADLPGRADAAAWSAWAQARLLAADAEVGLGRWNEARGWYRSPLFQAPSDGAPAWRTVHLGVDLFFAPAGTPVLAPLPGVVHAVRDNAGELDYGGTVILEHRVRVSGDDAPAGAPRPDASPPPGVPAADDPGVLRFWTLYGHLSRASLEALLPGQLVERGERVGALGTPAENGGWAPHLHLQLIGDLLDRDGEFPGVCTPGERGIWTSLSPDPTGLLLGLSPEEVAPAEPAPGEALSGAEIRLERDARIAPSLSIAYRRPLHIVRGWMQHLYDAQGQPYLDAVNNVAHVGHAHPRVTDAIARQARVLNTNTRYLHELLVRYAERLTATLPAPLEVCVLTSSGSEANELALRMARAFTGRRDAVVLEGAYHGNTSSLVELSPYKYRGPGGAGRAEWVHEAALPDPYRGRFGADAAAYAADVARALGDAGARGGAAAFFFEAMPGCGGQVVPPAGWLAAACAAARRAGALCVADEVQTGLGRVGSHWWAFQAVAGDEEVVPDIVTMGKPLGNGHPLGAVVTTRAVADAFANGMEYFNTFGGNPVSCAAGVAVLDVVEEEGLRAHAGRVGGVLQEGLAALAERHAVIGDVRGRGLYIGVELVRSRETRSPAGATANYVAERLRERGILLSTDGADHNVLKIKPPLPFSESDAERLLHELDEVLGEDPVRALYDHERP